MRRLIRAVLWLGLLATALWVARSALKAWIDGPEVTPTSGGWPDRPSTAADRPSPAADRPSPAADRVARTGPAKAGTPLSATEETELNGKAAAKLDKATGNGKPAGGKAPSAGKAAAAARAKSAKARKAKPGDSGNWVVPNGTAEILQTHPVKAKLASRVYRVPGMPMYDRTVADRCYATVEEAEADGFNRAAR